MKAMETEPIKEIPDILEPGTKIMLLGPLTVRRGIILLTNNNIRMLGGEVDEIKEQFNLVKILQQKIGKEDVGQKNMFAGNNTTPAVINNNPAPVIHHPPPQPVQPVIHHHDVAAVGDGLDDDDDDMLLLAASQAESQQENQIQDNPPASNNSSWRRSCQSPKSMLYALQHHGHC